MHKTSYTQLLDCVVDLKERADDKEPLHKDVHILTRRNEMCQTSRYASQ